MNAMMHSTYGHEPSYTEVTHQVAHLQLLQCLLQQEQVQTMTLAGMLSLLTSMQQEYGSETTLERIIQHRVGLQLAAQYEERKRRRVEATS